MIVAVVWVLMQVNAAGQYPGPYAFFDSRAECERALPGYIEAYKNPKVPVPPINGTFECQIDKRTVKERACLLNGPACEQGRVSAAIVDYERCLKKFSRGVCESYATCRSHILNADGSRMRNPNGTPAGLECH